MLRKTTALLGGVIVFLCLTISAQASGHEKQMMEQMRELRKLIEMQQKQLDTQAQEISELKRQLNQDTEAVVNTADKKEGGDTTKVVTSSLKKVDLSLYGHINRAALFADNGDDSRWYFVDNIDSQTRLGLNATVETFHNWMVGGRIEYGIVSNGSSDVNQLNDTDATSSNFKLRWSEVSFKHDSFGKISLGRGSTASDTSAEVDLSGTAVAAYTAVADMAGSMLWYDDATDTLTSLRIKDVFNDFDGLGRTDRLRYDSPSFAGFSIAASASSGEAYDASLWYARKFGETIFSAAIAAANPDENNIDMIYSGSASVLLPGGLNLTGSAATRVLDNSTADDPVNWYVKLGYKTKFYDSATTAFAIDYGETADLDTDGDTADTWAITAVHDISQWGTELYAIYRLYQLDRVGTDFEDINTFMTGARVKF